MHCSSKKRDESGVMHVDLIDLVKNLVHQTRVDNVLRLHRNHVFLQQVHVRCCWQDARKHEKHHRKTRVYVSSSWPTNTKHFDYLMVMWPQIAPLHNFYVRLLILDTLEIKGAFTHPGITQIHVKCSTMLMKLPCCKATRICIGPIRILTTHNPTDSCFIPKPTYVVNFARIRRQLVQ